MPKEDGAFLGHKTYDFREEFISYQDKSSEGRILWTAVKSIEEDMKAFYLYLDTMMALVTPKRAFHSAGDLDTFRSYLHSKR